MYESLFKNEPDCCTSGIRVAMIEHNGAPVEVNEFRKYR